MNSIKTKELIHQGPAKSLHFTSNKASRPAVNLHVGTDFVFNACPLIL